MHMQFILQELTVKKGIDRNDDIKRMDHNTEYRYNIEISMSFVYRKENHGHHH